MEKVILLGAPGAGKGTLSEMICSKHNLPHISVGDILRDNVSRKTLLGDKVNEYISKGKLVPDDVIIELIKDRLSMKDTVNGFLLDGFPRTIVQAEALDKISDLDLVVNIDVKEDVIVDRIKGRRVCSKCGSIFHVNNGVKDKCPNCSGKLIQRADDTEEVIKQRLHIYNEQTMPLIKFYEKRKEFRQIDGNKTPIEVFKEFEKLIK